MFLLKKLIFKFMELGLGLRPSFSLETRNPIFSNYRLSETEACAVQAALPNGFTLEKICFERGEEIPSFWVSYNLYEIAYPKKELRHIRKSRCEINTFVKDADGRPGIYVFSGSPYVSRETKTSFFGTICDFAERAAIWIYGCGKLITLRYELTCQSLIIDFADGPNLVKLEQPLIKSPAKGHFSDDYLRFNDISFFNEGKTFDLVNVNSVFFAARFHVLPGEALRGFQMTGPFFNRKPETVFFHRGDIPYTVIAMNRSRSRA